MARRRSDERGQSSLLLVFLTATLLVIATTLITMVGRGMTVQTETRTAADAAALAGADAIADQLDSRLGAVPSDDGLAFLFLGQLLALDPAVLTSTARAEAASIASQNGSNLTGMTVTPTLHGFDVQASVQSKTTSTESSSRRPTSDATAEVRISSGLLCFRGGGIGLFLGGSCVSGDDIHLVDPTLPPPDPEDPEEPPAEPPDEPWVFDGPGTSELLASLRGGLDWHTALTE
ncbi:pilus assembly protein TadG-related protein [Serinicoccus kebangsaanensis]|uniref:pilus assembly protein TadG-related protein n=1 Tax=Serinicoccus kebangsaanensis TaxID=2602069 RepID=UPI00124DD121|nr:pilus assembly protein TadG-related protein [Serinicoccus kebangsaanensis]